ncbi:hypothetical protein ACM66B_006211 [Microbotryomycetes sp. NB124-2]
MSSSDGGDSEPRVHSGQEEDPEARRERRRLKKLRKQQKRERKAARQAARDAAANGNSGDSTSAKYVNPTGNAAAAIQAPGVEQNGDALAPALGFAAPKAIDGQQSVADKPSQGIVDIFSRLADADMAAVTGTDKRKRSQQDGDANDNNSVKGHAKSRGKKNKTKQTDENGQVEAKSGKAPNDDHQDSVRKPKKAKKSTRKDDEDVTSSTGSATNAPMADIAFSPPKKVQQTTDAAASDAASSLPWARPLGEEASATASTDAATAQDTSPPQQVAKKTRNPRRDKGKKKAEEPIVEDSSPAPEVAMHDASGLDDEYLPEPESEGVLVPVRSKKKSIGTGATKKRRVVRTSDDDSEFEDEPPSVMRRKKSAKAAKKDEPLASGSGPIQLSVPEMNVATKWMTLKSLQEYTQIHKFQYRRGRFGRDEDKAIERAVDDYARQRNLSKEQVAAVIAAKKQEEDVYDTEFWPYLSLSYARKYGVRPILAIYNHVRLMFDSSRQSGGWSKEDENKLEALIKEHGTAWTKIGKELARVPTDCKDRYLQHILPGQNKDLKLGKWTQEEEDTLIDMVRQHGHKWTLISKTLGTRTPNQCRVKWRVAGGHDDIATKPWKWRRKDRSNLVHFLASQPAKSRSDIDWDALKDEVLLRHDTKQLDNRARIILNEAGSELNKEVSRDTWDDLMKWLLRRYPISGLYFTPRKFAELEAGEMSLEDIQAQRRRRTVDRQRRMKAKSEAVITEQMDAEAAGEGSDTQVEGGQQDDDEGQGTQDYESDDEGEQTDNEGDEDELDEDQEDE